MYDAKTRRFSAEDTVKGYMETPSTLVAYAYCLNSPMKFIDPDGLAPVDPNVYARAMGASNVTIETDWTWSAWSLPQRTRTANITYNNTTRSFVLDGDGLVDYSDINNAFGWNNPWIPNGRTYQAFLGSHPVAGSPWHHSSVLIFATACCPVFSVNRHFLDGARPRTFGDSDVRFTSIGGGATGGVGGQWGTLLGEFNRPTDLDLSTKNEMIPLNANSETINRMFQNTINFQNSPDLTYVLFPAQRSNSYNSGSFVAGLFNSVGITTTPTPNSPGWDKPVPASHFQGNNSTSQTDVPRRPGAGSTGGYNEGRGGSTQGGGAGRGGMGGRRR